MTTRGQRSSAVGGGRGRRAWNAILMRDLGLVRARSAARVLLCVPAGMAAGALVAMLTGLPLSVGLTIGALPAFLTCFVIVDRSAGRVAARSALAIVPFGVGLSVSLSLQSHRVLELVLLVALLFLQFYGVRFGDWGGDITAVLFAAVLCGLLLPLPETALEGLIPVGASSLAATIVVRSLLFRPNAYRSLRRTRRAFLAWGDAVLAAAVDVLEDPDASARRVTRLRSRLARLHEAALTADGLLGAGAGESSSAAEDLHRLLFDTELALEGIGRVAEDLALRDAPAGLRRQAAEALRRVRVEGGAAAEDAARGLLARAAAGPFASSDAALTHAVTRMSLLLADLSVSAERWAAIRASLRSGDETVPFASPVALQGIRIAGSVPVVAHTLAARGMSGPWRRLTVSAPLRTGIQAAIAVAIAEPLAYLIGGSRFYWAVIGVMVVLAGTNSTSERIRKTGNRVVGTVIGGVIGIPLVDLLGTDHVALSLAIILLCLTVGMYYFTLHYAVWVASLVVLLCQLYNFSGGFTDALLPLRLAENALGAVIAVLVAIVVLPVASGSMIRSAVRRQLTAIAAFVAALGGGADDEAGIRLRSDARAVDAASYQLEAVMKPLVRVSTGGPDRRDEETRLTLAAVAAYTRELAAEPDLEGLSGEVARRLREITDALVESLDALDAAVAGTPEGTWRRVSDLIDDLDLLLQDEPEGAQLQKRVHTLGHVDDLLAGLATRYGLAVNGDAYANVAPTRPALHAADRARRRFAD